MPVLPMHALTCEQGDPLLVCSASPAALIGRRSRIAEVRGEEGPASGIKRLPESLTVL